MTDTQAIKDRLDIVQIIGEYLQLKKAGANWKANCPFHQEKTPSFMVHPEKQIFHCFGCGKGGDVFTFVQEMEGFDFPEALKFLADRAGVKIDTYRSEIDKSQRNRILEINNKAAYFFHHFLLEMPGAQKARDYLTERKLKPETIEEWQVGFVPDQWDLLTQYLLKKGFGIDDLVLAGLTIKREGASLYSGKGFYDRFRGRIMFPIWDAHDNVVGFTGRILVETEHSGGKYVNTPQTLVYDKSRVLYGINKAKQEIKAKDLAVLVEGQMDVIACHQAGMKNVFAVSGTALTAEQIKLIKRYTNNAAFAFDVDAAGQNAAKRGIDAAIEQGLNTKIVQLPEGAGKDADECIKANSQIWFKAVEQAKDVMQWLFEKNLAGVDIVDPKQKQRAGHNLLIEISRLPYALERDHWLKVLAERLRVDEEVLREEMKSAAKDAAKEDRRGGSPPIDKKRDGEGSVNTLVVQTRYDLLLQNLWALLLKYPSLISAFWSSLKEDYFSGTGFGLLYDLAKKRYNTGSVSPEDLRADFGNQEQNFIDVLLLKADTIYGDYKESESAKEIELILAELNKSWVKNKREQLMEKLKEAQKNGDLGEVKDILYKIIELNE
ncbi:DNA primase [Patescibacteria group bacterium]|nr:MAG: DNA primase [Patescibacteria group bacterium]